MFPGDHIGSPLRMYVCPFRNSRHLVKCFSTRHSRALDETSRFRATTRRQNTPFIAHFGRCQKFAFRSVLPLSHKSYAFVGALRNHVSKCGFPRAPAASEHALYCSLFPLEKLRYFGGSSFLPQKLCFCGNPIPHPISKFAALGKMFFHSA